MRERFLRWLVEAREVVGRRRLLIASGAVVFGGLLAVLMAGSIARSRQGFNPLFVSGVLLLSAVLTMVVLFVLGRNLVKLYLARSRGVPGSGYRTKVISLVVALTLLPSLLLFFTASGILQASVDQWFQWEVEGVLRVGMDIVNRYESVELERSVHLASRLAATIREAKLMRTSQRRPLARLLSEKREEWACAGLRVYDSTREVVAEAYEGGRAEALRELSVPNRAIGDLLQGRSEILRHAPEKTGELLFLLGVPIEEGGRRVGAVVVVTGLGMEPSAWSRTIYESRQVYLDARANQQNVKQGFVLVLAFFTLLLLLSAMWVGSALAKGMTVPILRLAAATRAVSEGRLDVRVEADATDELGALVQSFNRMVEELRQGRAKVEQSTDDLQRTNIELDGRRKYIETILGGVPTGVISLDQEGYVTNCNRAAAEMLGLASDEVLGRHYREVFGGKEFLELYFLMGKVIGIRDIRLTRDLHMRVNRRAIDLAVSFTALRDAQERYMGLIVVLEDLSNLIKAQKVAAWREVARRIAHEIKNPLTPIQLSAQRILKKWREGDSDFDRVVSECTETITQEVDGLKTLVNEFSRFARMPPVAPEPISVERVVQSAMMLYEGLHPGMRIERSVSEGIPILNLDPEGMKRVLINLIDNAIHCQAGTGRVTVNAWHDARTQSVHLEVADEGPGIAPEDRDKLFVPYFSTKRGGTGLGLAIVHRIVSDHNGRIRIEENVPRGTRFVIDLPA